MLEAHSITRHPFRAFRGFLNHEASQLFVGLAFGYAQNVFEELILRVNPGHDLRRGVVHAPQISGMPAVSGAHIFRCALQHQHASAFLPGAQGGCKCRITAAHHKNIYCW